MVWICSTLQYGFFYITFDGMSRSMEESRNSCFDVNINTVVMSEEDMTIIR